MKQRNKKKEDKDMKQGNTKVGTQTHNKEKVMKQGNRKVGSPTRDKEMTVSKYVGPDTHKNTIAVADADGAKSHDSGEQPMKQHNKKKEDGNMKQGNTKVGTQTHNKEKVMKQGNRKGGSRTQEKEMKVSKYVGLDTHKNSIAVAVADADGAKVRYHGAIPNTPEAVDKLVKKLGDKNGKLSFCYEAGPCGYDIHRQLKKLGCDCMVVAPSLIPRKPGDRVKTDRRDSESLARLYRAGELTGAWVPDKEQEAIRDLTRAREDMKHLERQARQRLGAFLLRNSKIYTGKSKWTQAHFRWLESVKFDDPVQQIVFQEYIDTVKQLTDRVKALEKEMERAWPSWSLAPVVKAMMALRGCRLVAAMTVLAELGDLTRFDSPRQLMAYLGLVPREHSSGGKTRRGGITKTGNGHARRILIEAGWCYRFQARKSACIQRRAEQTPPEIQAVAWEAQKRLCGRYAHLRDRGKCAPVTVTAIARELAGFMWAVAREQKRLQDNQKAA